MSRLIWGALSGMEVSLYVFLTLLALTWHIRYDLNSGLYSYFSTFALALAALARPECYVLFPIAWLDRILMGKYRLKRILISFLTHLVLYTLIIVPYWIFNISIQGSLFPATFHAKVRGGLYMALSTGDVQMLLEAFTTRLLDFIHQYIVFCAENNAVLLILACLGLVSLIRRRRQKRSIVVLLVIMIVPVTVGIFSGWGELVSRYIANLIPLYAILAAAGIERIARWIKGLHLQAFSTRFKIIIILILVLAIVNAGIVAVKASVRYSWMVENINTMQVSLGHWIAENIPTDALIAINDIGAITYISNRQIIDTVGLATPDIIPYLKREGYTRDENLLLYLQEHKPDYLIVFPKWYPRLLEHTDLFEPIYTHHYTGDRIVCLGDKVMVVYRCHWPEE